MLHSIKYRFLTLALVATFLTTVPALAGGKNVFMMVTDGASFGAWDLADLYTHGSTAASPYYSAEFKKYLMTTYPLNMSNAPTGGKVPQVSYDPAQAWNSTPIAGQPGKFFEGYEYLKQNATDSAAAGTALAAGQKTYNNAINWSNDPAATGAPTIPTIPELAKDCGKAVGTISSVQWSHATPSAFSNAHNISRNDYLGIANSMLNGKVMDVIMGAGHPQFNDNGVRQIVNYNAAAITDSVARYVGGRGTWISLNEGTHPEGWTLIQTLPEFEKFANSLPAGANPASLRLIGTAEVGSTLQQSRGGFAATDKVGEDPPNKNVPTLLTMTKGAVNVLDAKSKANGKKGFFLHIEGGAIDWAAHANQASRLVEEQLDFNNTVSWVIGWIEANGGWDNNLLIITTDHGNAMPLGPNSDSVFMERLVLNDINGVPTVRWHSTNHTNELVPLFARGAGAEMFDALVDGNDPYFVSFYADWAAAGFDGRYVDNADVYLVLKAQVCQTPIPGSVMLLITGVAGMIVIGRRRVA